MTTKKEETSPRDRSKARIIEPNESPSTYDGALLALAVAEAAWDDLQDGVPIDRVVPFWRAIEPDSPIARRLRCGADWIRAMRESEASPAPEEAP